jgi:hypothetical protein
MNETNFGSGGNEGEGRQRVHPDERPYWKHIHHNWLFWVGMVLVSAAIAIYVLSDNLALLPRGQPRPALSDTSGK